jgi:DNA processing protein
MPIHRDDEFFLRLSLTRGVGARTAHKLLTEFGDIGNVFSASEASLAKCVGEKTATAIAAAPTSATKQQIDDALKWLDEAAHHLLTWSHADYPKALFESGDAPVVLYANGALDVLKRPAVALVGSRNCSQGGADTAEAFAEALAKSGVTIVSGLALGIDAAAHAGALRAGGLGAGTIAVIGTGIDRIYPARNKTLAHSIAETGLIVSEYPLGTPPLAENFPRRNRIISGLSQGVLVVEASMQSGSLITARLAGEQGREVFAIPGSIHSTFHKGCHYLIKQGAKLVETAQDILEELRIETAIDVVGDRTARSNVSAGGKHDSSLAQTHQGEVSGLLKYLEHTPIDIDMLVQRSGLPIEQVVTELTILELNQRAESLAGGLWQRRK